MELAEIRAAELKCEYHDNPLGIDILKPRLGWIVESDRRCAIQKAYQVLVSSSREKLASNDGDLWDSGKISSCQSNHIEYGGKSLYSGLRCYWKVRVWDGADRVSEYSSPSWWEMGLISPGDWKAKWIGRKIKVSREYHGLIFTENGGWPGKWTVDVNKKELDDDTWAAPMLRKNINIGKKVKKARAYICGLGYYELYLNGKRVGDHVLDPAFTRYDSRLLYVTYDVKEYLESDINTVGVILGNGWYNQHSRSPWTFDEATWRSAPKMILQVNIEYEDGSTETVISDKSWKIAQSPLVWNDLFGGETYDARLEKEGWGLPGYDDSEWQMADTVRAPFGKLEAQAIEPIKVTRFIKPVKITEPKPGVFVYNMGQNFSGWIKLTVTGPAGTEIVMKYSQSLLEDGTIDERPNRACLDQSDPSHRSHMDVYILKGKGAETWESKFCYHGFQYVEITGFPGQPSLEDLCGCFVHTAVSESGYFECSNDLFNKIWRNTRWTHLSNLHSIPTDCPHREKNGWTGDAHLAAEQAIYNYNMANFYTKWMKDFKDVQKESGDIPAIVPTANDWGYHLGIAWDSAYFLIPWYMYQYYGDIRILENHYESMKRYLDGMAFKVNDNIVSFGFDDWVCPGERTPVEVISTSYYYTDTLILSKIAGLLGRKNDEVYYKELAGEIKIAFNRTLYNEETGIYGNGSQASLSCALYQGLVEEKNIKKVVQNLVEKVNKHDGHLDTGILGTKYLLEALSKYERTDVAYTIATQTSYPSWGYWISNGLTTLCEQWDHNIIATSWNHIAFGVISAWFFKALAGINTDEENPGFKNILIKPNPVGDLTYVKGEYHSVNGVIISEWEKKDDKFLLNIAVPANTTARIYVPAADKARVFEGNIPAHESYGVKYLQTENEYIAYSVGSGNYCFTVIK